MPWAFAVSEPLTTSRISFDALGDTELKYEDKRREAMFTLKNWLSRSAAQAALLYDRKTRTGLLRDRDFSPENAEVVLELLYGPTLEARKQPETYSALIAYLRHERQEIRELAYWNLLFLVPERGRKIPYSSAGGADHLNAAYEAWKKLIREGTIPPEQSEGPRRPNPARNSDPSGVCYPGQEETHISPKRQRGDGPRAGASGLCQSFPR